MPAVKTIETQGYEAKIVTYNGETFRAEVKLDGKHIGTGGFCGTAERAEASIPRIVARHQAKVARS